MRTDLYLIDSPWPGRLAIALRPRGGDWLEDEIQAWQQVRVDMVLSLLTPDEMESLELVREGELCQANGVEFISFPIPDRGVPSSVEVFTNLVTQLAENLTNQHNLAIHCRQGIGRAALVAICLLVHSGLVSEEAIQRVTEARGCAVPETPEQRKWIADFARALQLPK